MCAHPVLVESACSGRGSEENDAHDHHTDHDHDDDDPGDDSNDDSENGHWC